MKKIILLVLCLFSTFTTFSQQELWTPVNKSQTKSKKQKDSINFKHKAYTLDINSLTDKLKKAPAGRENLNSSTLTISFPNEEGIIKTYKIAEASVLAPELQKAHSNIKSYIGIATDGSNKTIRFSFSDYTGFDGIILNNTAPSTILKKNGKIYQVYSQADLPHSDTSFECETLEDTIEAPRTKHQKKNAVSSGSGKLRTYRLALMTTGEYSQHLLEEYNVDESATESTKKTIILAHLNSLVTSVNAVFERDLSVTLQLITQNKDVIFLDPETDGLLNDNESATSGINQNICDATIGNSNYDIGHSIFFGGGGVAYLRSVCNTTRKASATSGHLDSNTFFHELGHQFGAYHTFNNWYGNTNASTGAEVGKGYSIMSYGSTARKLFFHSISLTQMNYFLSSTSTCETTNDTDNTAPTANAGSNYTIPKSTPFLLEGTATDSESSNLTYSWEQIDTELSEDPPLPTDLGPLFQWKAPNNNPTRYFPNIETILSGELANPEEVLPSISRDLNFTFQVRDNDIRGGETNADNTTITVDANAGPFSITSHNSTTEWLAGTTTTITWNVANTDSGTVNTPTVDILFSTDGGFTFPTTIAHNIPNTGSYNLEIPSNMASTDNGRYMVKGHNNVFFDINNTDISVDKKEFVLTSTATEKNICFEENTISFDFVYKSFLGFSNTVNFSASGTPTGTNISFSTLSTNTNNTEITLSVNNITESNIGIHPIEITATSGELSYTLELILTIYGSVLEEEITLSNPQNNSSNISPYVVFSWDRNTNPTNYLIEIATNNSFTNLIATETVTENSFTHIFSESATTYFWRVKPVNNCNSGNWSNIYTFRTRESTYVPDDNFEQALIDLGYDSPPLDNYISKATASSIRRLDVTEKEINDLTGIEDFSDLYYLKLNENNISTIDVSNNLNLRYLYITDNNLTNINISQNERLHSLNLSGNNISAIDISQNTSLQYLYLFKNTISSLNVTNHIQLKHLGCSYNSLTTIDISQNTLLESLQVSDNYLNSLNIENNTLLELLSCSDNYLTDLNVTNHTALSKLYCSENQLKTLDLSNNANLTKLSCGSNSLTSLNLKNGNNNLLEYLYTRENPDLACILIDNINEETPSSWYIDTTSSYAENCDYVIFKDILITTTSETCTGKNNGSIKIDTNTEKEYNLTLNGLNNGIFQTSKTFSDLSSGDYEVCLSYEDNTQCFIAEVSSPVSVAAKSTTSGNKTSFTIEQGTAPYNVTLNGKEILKTTAPAFTIETNPGDAIEIKTSIACEGSIHKKMSIAELVQVTPNPTKGDLSINTHTQGTTLIEVYNPYSQLVFSKTDTSNTGKISIDLGDQPDGLYFVKLQTNNEKFIFKILKQ